MPSTHSFSIADYVVFSATILVSLSIGVYSALSGGRQRTTQEYLIGNRKMKVLPVALSLIVSFESSIMMLGYPAEIYAYGIGYWATNIAIIAVMTFTALLIVPTFYDLKIVSAYEYLQVRFKSRTVRLIGSFLGVMSNLWYMGIVLFGPAVALEAVTGFPMWNSIVVIAGVALIYTTIGGIKAVIWADAFQTFIMIGGMLAVIIKGSLDAGGFSRVVEINREKGRLQFFNFDFNPTVRHTTWGLVIGGLARILSIAVNQTTVQRISSMPSKTKAQLITVLAGPGFLLFSLLAYLEGLVAYAYFSNTRCDPLKAGIIRDPNQIIPYFVMELFEHIPGLPGLFLAALFSASLSTLSSGYASIAAIVWTDFFKPIMPNLVESKATLITKCIVVVSGFLSIGIAVVVMQVGGTMNQISGMLLSGFSAPLAALFLLGGLFSSATWKGAIAAVITSSTICLWKGFGSSFSPGVVRTPYLPGGSIENCTLSNYSLNSHNYTALSYISTLATTVATGKTWSSNPLTLFYSISYLWIAPLALIITLVVGVGMSYATGATKKEDRDGRYAMSLCDRLCCCLPDRLRARFRVDVQGDDGQDTEEMKHFPVENDD